MQIKLNKKFTSGDLKELNAFLISVNAGFTTEKMDLYWAEGFLCAICSAPVLLLPSQWQRLLFPEDFEFKTEEEAGRIASLLFGYYNLLTKICTITALYPYMNGINLMIGNQRKSSYKDGAGVTYLLWV